MCVVISGMRRGQARGFPGAGHGEAGRFVNVPGAGREAGSRASDTLIFFFFFRVFNPSVGFPVGTVVKNPPANAGDTVGFLGQEDPLEEGTAIHSGILAWRIPWTEEPGGLQSLGSQRVRHD